TCFTHRFKSFVIRSDSRRTRPGQLQRLKLGAQLDRTRLLNIEGIVVEEKLSHIRPVLFGFGHLAGYVISRTFAPGVPAGGLRPQTESALCRTSTGGVKRDV